MSVDSVDDLGWTKLHHAVAAGDAAEVDRLLGAGASASASNDRTAGSGHRGLTDGGAPLLLAVERGELALVERLLRAKAKAIAANCCGVTPLHVAAYRGRVEIAERLLSAKAKLDAKVKVYEGHALLSPDARPLHAAARGGSTAMITLLLERGAAIDAQDVDGETSLAYAIRCGHDDATRLLLERGAGLEVRHPSILMRAAAAAGPGRLLALLVERGATIASPTWMLHLAARNPNHDAVPTLHRLGVDLTARDANGWTALHWAAFGGEPAAAAYLLAHGVDPAAVTHTTAKVRVVAGLTHGWLRWNLERSVPAGSTAGDIAALAQDTRHADERARRLWNAKCQGVARLLLPRPAASRVDELGAMLEHAIWEAGGGPGARDAWAVYADWLLERGDPRGELAHVQLAIEEVSCASAPGPLAQLRAREAELLARHRRAWLGDTAGLPARAVFSRGVLRELDLQGTSIDDRGVVALQAHTWLRHLDLTRTKITDLALESIAALPGIETLRLAATNVTDAAMPSLRQMTTLVELDLAATHVTGAGLAELAQLPSLRRLHLGGVAAISDVDVDVLLRCSHLDTLDIHLTSISPAGVAALRAERPELCIIHPRLRSD